MKVLTAEQMREVDRRTIEEIGLPGVVLMENAGRCVAGEILARYASSGMQRALVLSGKGNNGGDGYVVARHLLDHDWDVVTVVFAEANAIVGDAAVHLRTLLNCGGQVLHVTSETEFDAAFDDIGEFSVVVDALLGTGLVKPLQGLLREVVGWINCQLCPVVAVDIPSGVEGSTGRILGDAVNADLTVSFAFPKIGQVTYPGARHVGELVVADIGIPVQIAYEAPADCLLIDEADARQRLPRRSADSHKGTFGHLLVVAGSMGKCGAAVMTAESGLRGGAGLVTLACPVSVQPGIAARLAEVMTAPLPEQDGALGIEAHVPILDLLADKRALVIGPGLGASEQSTRLVQRLVEDVDLPLVLDADGLNAICGHLPERDTFAGREMVLTPHPGEMARLTGLSVVEVQADRFRVARDFALRHGVVLVLKGARTLVACPDGVVHVNTTGHVGMASAGMGDVLAGLIGSLLAQGLSAKDAAALGVYLHGLAADRLLGSFGDAGLLATDLLYELPAARQALTREG